MDDVGGGSGIVDGGIRMAMMAAGMGGGKFATTTTTTMTTAIARTSAYGSREDLERMTVKELRLLLREEEEMEVGWDGNNGEGYEGRRRPPSRPKLKGDIVDCILEERRRR